MYVLYVCMYVCMYVKRQDYGDVKRSTTRAPNNVMIKRPGEIKMF